MFTYCNKNCKNNLKFMSVSRYKNILFYYFDFYDLLYSYDIQTFEIIKNISVFLMQIYFFSFFIFPYFFRFFSRLNSGNSY